MDYSKITNIQFEGIDHSDYPDYCDTYIVSAGIDGVELSEDEIEELNDDKGFIHEKLTNYLN